MVGLESFSQHGGPSPLYKAFQQFFILFFREGLVKHNPNTIRKVIAPFILTFKNGVKGIEEKLKNMVHNLGRLDDMPVYKDSLQLAGKLTIYFIWVRLVKVTIYFYWKISNSTVSVKTDFAQQHDVIVVETRWSSKFPEKPFQFHGF